MSVFQLPNLMYLGITFLLFGICGFSVSRFAWFEMNNKEMAQEGQHKRCSDSSCDGARFPKKAKQKKTPQRGIGMGELERIRREEERRNGVLPPAHLGHFNPSSSVQFAPRSPNNNYTQLPSIPMPSAHVRSPSLTMPSAHVPSPNLTNVYSHEMMNSTGFFMGWSQGNVNGNVYAGGSNLQGVSRPNWPPYYARQPRQPHPQQLSSPVNVPLWNSSSSSRGNLQIEHPSNQSYYGNYPLPMSPEEMVSMKRWPDNTPMQSFPYQFAPLPPTISRSNESSLCNYGNGGMLNYESRSANVSELHSGSALVDVNGRENSFQLNQRKKIQENRSLDGDFLTLGLPTTYELKQPSALLPVTHKSFDMFSFQGRIEDSLKLSSISGRKQSVHNSFPLAGEHMGCSTTSRGEAGDDVDLNLKL